MTLFGRMHRHPLALPVSTPTAWIATGLGLTSVLLAQLAARLAPAWDEVRT